MQVLVVMLVGVMGGDRKWWEWPTILLLCLLLVTDKNANGQNEDSGELSCQEIAGEGGNRALERCFNKGERFLTRYLNSIRRRRKGYDKCDGLDEFTDCVDPLLVACPLLKPTMEKTWGPLLEQLKCACNGTQVCVDTMECVEEQYTGVLARRCDAYYRFNVQQKTRHKCSFIAENVQCKQALIDSGCGHTGLGRALSTLSASKTISNAGCTVIAGTSDDTDYTGFYFDDDCPADLGARMKRCQGKHLRSGQRIDFHDNNDLVTKGTADDVSGACQNYHDYADCVSPLKEQCPLGSSMYLQHESRLRTYLMKLAYICDKAFQAYASNLDCYSEVLSHQNLTQCDHIFESLRPLLQKVTAFQFYCRPGEEGSANLRDHLDHLRQCYEGVFSASCDREGGSAMNGLIREVFNDPFYLRYKYQPDCSLHSLKDPTTPAPSRPPDRSGRDRLVASTAIGLCHSGDSYKVTVIGVTLWMVLPLVERYAVLPRGWR